MIAIENSHSLNFSIFLPPPDSLSNHTSNHPDHGLVLAVHYRRSLALWGNDVGGIERDAAPLAAYRCCGRGDGCEKSQWELVQPQSRFDLSTRLDLPSRATASLHSGHLRLGATGFFFSKKRIKCMNGRMTLPIEERGSEAK